MATKDDRPGLLSKVAMFVRNPTKDWSELDQPMDSDSSGYDKQALKAMIERKRQNDFVRKREFDQLRKLRNRDPGTLANMARPSFFQTSLPTEMDGRAVTLKKIDEIEAQMSRQWWKAKSDGATQPFTLPPTQDSVAASPDTSVQMPAKNQENLTVSFASTLPFDMHATPDDADQFQPTQMASVPGLDMLEGYAPRADTAAGFSPSRLFAIEVDEMATDPELEEAAIRFANSDDAGAENGLLAALRGNDLAPHAAQSWAAALLDFYRATNRRAAFESASEEFALHLDGAQPVWAALGGTAAARQAPGSASSRPSGPIWSSPATLSAPDMEQLRAAMMSQPMPWYLDWSALENITPDAFSMLEGLFASLCEEDASLRFDGEDRVMRALHALTPSGDRSVNPACWEMRLNALRAMRMQDEFELAALDYCVTFGVSPPAWTDARCRLVPSGQALTPSEPGAVDGVQELSLQGEVLGDATQVLVVLDAAPAEAKRVWIACDDLVRVDFAAAGSILNWVAMRQAEGKHVQFQNVHRLVAAFFNVIGINEHAKVIPRPI